MIITLLINLIFIIFASIFTLLPEVTIADIPYIGSFIQSTLLTMVKMWNAFIVTFPYADVPWKIFLFVVLPFEILMLIAKFFLGHRLPTNQS